MFFGRGGPFGGGGDDDDDDEDPRQQMGKEKDDDPEHKKLYDALGVDKKCSQADITKTFRKLAMTHHPDRGGDPEKFKQLQHAYEILSNEEKRASYDKYGEGGDPRARGGGGMEDIFGMFGGRGGGGGGRRRKGDDVVFPLKVELHELYKGATKKLKLTKNVICKSCKGRGGKDGIAASKCATCRGQGVRMVVRQLGPGMIQQMQMQCNVCDGRGSTMADKDKCTDCHGERTVKESKTLEVNISTGMAHNQRITFKGEADQSPDAEPGDVVVVLQQKEHPEFRRDGMNLFMKKKLTLSEALAGFEFKITHLDGKVLHVKSEEGMIVRPGEVKVIKEQGMPALKSMLNFGNLYVEMDVEFPASKSLDLKTREQITKLLGGTMPSADQKTAKPAAKPNAQAPASGATAAAAGAAGAAGAKANRKARRAAAAAAAAAGKPAPAGGAGSDDDDLPPLEKQDGAGASGAGSATAEPVEEDVTLEDVDMAQEKQKFAQQRAEAASHNRSEHEDDDDERGHGHGPGCRAQ